MSEEAPLEGSLDDGDYEDDAKKETLTPQEVVEEIAKGGEQLIIDWHNTILKEPPKFDAFLEPTNTLKNRYPNVILYDRSRVKLRGDKVGDDYYHASYVDSYGRPDGYILAQAPFDETTESDFWRMVYQTRIKLIVLLTETHTREGARLIKHFWPTPKKNTRDYMDTGLKVECLANEAVRLFDWYGLSVEGVEERNKGKMKLFLLHYRKWVEDKVIPDDMLEFRAEVKKWDARETKKGNMGPVCLMCPTGVHRSGTYAVLDIVLDRVNAEKKVGLLETASIVRKQRYGCMTHYVHYSHVADLIVRHAVSSGIVDAARVSRKD